MSDSTHRYFLAHLTHMCSRRRRFSAENFPKVLSVVDAVSDIAKRHSATAGQVALAWLLAQGADIIPIPGTRKKEVHLRPMRVSVHYADSARFSLVP